MFEKLIALFAHLMHTPIGLKGGAARTKRRPVGVQLRSPQDPAQASQIQAAKDKRQRRAEKLTQQTNQSWSWNYAHHDAFRTLDNFTGFVQPLRLNPFYVAK